MLGRISTSPVDFVAIILQPMIHLWIPNGSNRSSKSIRSGGNVNYVSKGRNVLIRSGLSDLHRGTGGKWSQFPEYLDASRTNEFLMFHVPQSRTTASLDGDKALHQPSATIVWKLHLSATSESIRNCAALLIHRRKYIGECVSNS